MTNSEFYKQIDLSRFLCLLFWNKEKYLQFLNATKDMQYEMQTFLPLIGGWKDDFALANIS